MRISTNYMFETSAARLSELQSKLMTTQQQIATGRRIMTPADDPVAAARAFDITQAQSANSQYATNRQNVKYSLGLEEGVLQSVTTLLQDVKSTMVSAANASYSDEERKYLATELRASFDELLGLANSADGLGGYLFSGFQSGTQPYAQSATGAVYNGDQGQRMLQVSIARQMSFSDSGSDVFEQIKTGNGSFAISATATNAGTGLMSQGMVVDSSLLTGQEYSVAFSVVGDVTTYDVINTTTGLPVSTGNPYVSGQEISFDGMQFSIKGAPADGDNFTLEPSRNQSMFATLRDLINLIDAPGGGPVNQTKLFNGLTEADSNISNALDKVLTIRASVGSRLKELDSLDNAGEDANIQFAQTLAQLQDLDYTQAISSMVNQQTVLTAAQQSFAKVSGLSLFNFI